MKKLLLTLAVGMLAIGCASVSQERIRKIKCSGSVAECHEKAGDLCGERGYEVVEEEEKRHVYNPSVVNMRLWVRCKERADTAQVTKSDEDIKSDVKISDKSTLYSELMILKKLRDEGLITEEEFEIEKKELLEKY